MFSDIDEDQAIKIIKAFKEDIDKFKDKIWLIDCLTQEALVQNKHYWKEIFRDCELSFIEPN